MGPTPGRADTQAAAGTAGLSQTDEAQAAAASVEALGEVDLSTGSARTSYPFSLPAARGEAQPSLGLVYDSSNGLGFAGMGWTLNVPSIVRKGKAGIPRFTDVAIASPATLGSDLNADDYYIDGRLLIPVAAQGDALAILPRVLQPVTPDQWAVFRAEVDDGNRYFFNGKTWIMQTKTRMVQFGHPLDGGSPAVELADPDTAATFPQPTGWPPNPIYRWDLVRDTDATGNTVYYVWDAERQLINSFASNSVGIQYLTDIYDTSSQQPSTDLTAAAPATTTFAHHVKLSWGLAQYPGNPAGPNATSSVPYVYSPIWRALPYAELTNVDVMSATWGNPSRQLVRRYALSYTYNKTLTRAYLSSIQPVGNCLQNGGPVRDVGVVFPLNTCQAAEGMPPTVYTYRNVPPTTPTAPSPSAITKSASFSGGAGGAADFLIDVDGDSIAELIGGANGFTNYGCLATSTCGSKNTAWSDSVATGLTLGIWSLINPPTLNPCWSCFIAGSVQGPGQTSATAFNSQTASDPNNGLLATKLAANDGLWSISVFADWASTGRMNFLELLPAISPFASTLQTPIFTNAQAAHVFLGQLSDPTLADLTFRIKSLTASLNAQEVNRIAFGLGWFGGQSCSTNGDCAGVGTCDPQSLMCVSHCTTNADCPTRACNTTLQQCQTPSFWPGAFNPANAFDIDGDALPDMGLLQLGNPPAGRITTGYATFFSTKDRAGTVHPFLSGPADLCAPSTYATDTFGPSGTPVTQTRRQLVDMDGDGLADIVDYNKFGFNWSGPPPRNFLNARVLVNRGDGRFGEPMPVGSNSCGTTTYGAAVNKERSLFASDGDALGPDTTQASMIRFGDLNGDGMADYAVLDSQGLHICLRTGASWATAHWSCETVNDSAITGNDQSNTNIGHPTIMIGDIDGSGIKQVVYFPKATSPFVGPPGGTATAFSATTGTKGRGSREGLMTNISNGRGATTEFSYNTIANLFPPSGSLPNANRSPVPRWVVTSIESTNNLTAYNNLGSSQLVDKTTSYTYDAPIFDARDRQFLGFRSVTAASSPDNAGSPGTVVKTTFATTASCGSSPTCNVGTVDYSVYRATRGLPAIVETSRSNGGAPSVKYTTAVKYYTFQTPYLGLDQRSGISAKEIDEVTYLWDEQSQAGTSKTFQPIVPPGATTPLQQTQVTTNVPTMATVRTTFLDANGNQIEVDEHDLANVTTGIGTGATLVKHTWAWNLPAGDTTGWSYRPTKEVTSGNLGVTREVDNNYDSQGRLFSVTRVLQGTQTLPGVAGAPRIAAPPNQSVDGGPTTLYVERDGFGNVFNIFTSSTHCLKGLTYDSLYNHLLASVTSNPGGGCTFDPITGHATPAGGLTTTYTYDRGFELPTQIVDSAGRFTNMVYDDFGRIWEVDQPSISMLGGTLKALAVVKYQDTAPISTVHFQTAFGPDTTGTGNAGGYVDHYTYTDGFGETRASVDAVDAATHANFTWRLSGVHSSYSNGRLNTTFLPMYVSSAPTLGTLPRAVVAPTSAGASAIYDGLGRAIRGTDYRNSVWQRKFHTARLSVDILDQEQNDTNSPHNGSLTTLTADGVGRVVTVDDHLKTGPDGKTGDRLTTFAYQGTGETLSITQKLPGGQNVVRSMAYDTLGRLVRATEPNTGTWTYAYDNFDQLVGTADARGCGENIWRDYAERVIGKDYIPCATATGASTQAAYSPPNVTPLNGDGFEEFYVYDSAGQLTDAYDQARHDSFAYHPNGLVKTLTTQIASPTGSYTVANRYADYSPNYATYQKQFTNYDVAGQPLGVTTTNALVLASIFPSFASFSESFTYGMDEQFATSAASFADWSGKIVSSSTYNADGTLAGVTYGDVAGTHAIYGYYPDGQLSSYHLTRAGGTGANGAFIGTVSPPPPVPPGMSNSTTQADLLSLIINRDKVGNPNTIRDGSSAAWPPTAQRVSSLKYFYYDDYRLQAVTANNGGDSFLSPYAADPAGTYPVVVQPSTNMRMQNQSYQYDWRGNMTRSTDDANAFPDRSLNDISNGLGFGAQAVDAILGATSVDGQKHVSAFYDAAGNTVEVAAPGNVYVFTWDELGHLQQAQRFGVDGLHVQETYVYDRHGQRVMTQRSNSSTAQPLYTVNVFDTMVLKNARFITPPIRFGCSQGGTFCVPGNVCVNRTCQPCGGSNQPACTCGGNGQSCCGFNMCMSGFGCFDGSCSACGGAGQPACSSPSGFYQDDSTAANFYLSGGLVHVAAIPGLPVNTNTNAGTTGVHWLMNLPDANGSGAFVVDYQTGEVVERTAYLPYGATDTDYRPARWASLREDVKLTSNWDNAEVGLVYMNARYYMPELGRFISPDPATIHGFSGDPNPYEYAFGNPVLHSDSGGLGDDPPATRDATVVATSVQPTPEANPGDLWFYDPSGRRVGSVRFSSMDAFMQAAAGHQIFQYVPGASDLGWGTAVASQLGSALHVGSGDTAGGEGNDTKVAPAATPAGQAAPGGGSPALNDALSVASALTLTPFGGPESSDLGVPGGACSDCQGSTLGQVLWLGGMTASAAIGAAIGPVAEEVSAANRAAFEAYKDSLRAAMEKPSVANRELQTLMGQLYRPGATVGSGSTAAAVRAEAASGVGVGGRMHAQKAADYGTALHRWLARNPTARPGDRAAAENVLRDLQNALKGR